MNAMNRVREIEATDRGEWLRMLMSLYPRTAEADHAPSVDAYFSGDAAQSLIPAVVFVSERPDSGLSGFLELSIRNYAEGCSGSTPYIESWYVDTDARGFGIGRQLVEAAEDWARAQGYDEIASDADLGNTGSHAAHQAAGFTEVERVVHFRKRLRGGQA